MTKMTKNMTKRGVTRRSVLKGSAAAAGLAAGSGVVTGFPTIWAQNIKDVTINHTGMSYSTLIDIARKASEDLGFKVEMSVTDHPGLTNRMVNDPKSIDVADSEIWQTKIYVPLGVTQAIDTKKIKLWDKVTPLYTQGVFAGKEVSRQGDSPYEIMYRDAINAKAFHDGLLFGIRSRLPSLLLGVSKAFHDSHASARRVIDGQRCWERRIIVLGTQAKHID